MKKIETLTNPNNKRQAVFVVFYTKKKVWDGINIEIPLIMMTARWEGNFGFIGGNVDAGETLHQAAIREVKEEIGYTLSPERLVPITSHEFSIVSHLFAVECSFEEFKQIQKLSPDAEHYGSETGGCFPVHVFNYGKFKPKKPTAGIVNILCNQFAKSVKEEIIDLCLHMHWFKKQEMKELCQKVDEQNKNQNLTNYYVSTYEDIENTSEKSQSPSFLVNLINRFKKFLS